jgi:hypothetical protein
VGKEPPHGSAVWGGGERRKLTEPRAGLEHYGASTLSSSLMSSLRASSLAASWCLKKS